MTLLLLSSRVLRRGSLGKPSSLTMTLSERSRLSNWFCMNLHMVTDYSREAFNTACCVALQGSVQLQYGQLGQCMLAMFV